MTPKAVLDYLTSHEERFIEELFAYTRIPSISAQSDHADDMQRCAEWLADRMIGLGTDARDAGVSEEFFNETLLPPT